MFDSGPEVVTGDTWGGSSMGNFNDPIQAVEYGEQTGNTISLNHTMLDKLEQLAAQGNAESYSGLAFLVLTTVFHEYIHYGRWINHKDKGVVGELQLLRKSLAPNEAGKNWEVSLYGKVMERDSDGEGPHSMPASKFLKIHRGNLTNKYAFGSPFDVTKGIAPNQTPTTPKKPDGSRAPKTHKPRERKAGQ